MYQKEISPNQEHPSKVWLLLLKQSSWSLPLDFSFSLYSQRGKGILGVLALIIITIPKGQFQLHCYGTKQTMLGSWSAPSTKMRTSLVSVEQHIWGCLDLKLCWIVTSQCAFCCIHFFMWLLNINLRSSDLFTQHLPLWSHLSGTVFWYHFLPQKWSLWSTFELNFVCNMRRSPISLLVFMGIARSSNIVKKLASTKSNDHTFMGLFLNSHFYWIDLYTYTYGSTHLLWLCIHSIPIFSIFMLTLYVFFPCFVTYAIVIEMCFLDTKYKSSSCFLYTVW